MLPIEIGYNQETNVIIVKLMNMSSFSNVTWLVASHVSLRSWMDLGVLVRWSDACYIDYTSACALKYPIWAEHKTKSQMISTLICDGCLKYFIAILLEELCNLL